LNHVQAVVWPAQAEPPPTFAPGSTLWLVVDHRTEPVVTPQPSKQILWKGGRREPCQCDLWQHGEIGEGRAAHIVMDLLAPMEKRLVPSGITPLACVARMEVHRLVFCERQDLRLPGIPAYERK